MGSPGFEAPVQSFFACCVVCGRTIRRFVVRSVLSLQRGELLYPFGQGQLCAGGHIGVSAQHSFASVESLPAHMCLTPNPQNRIWGVVLGGLDNPPSVVGELPA